MRSHLRALAVTFAVLVAVFAATHVASFPGTVTHFREVTGGQELLDLRASSSADETWQRLHAMGPEGREAYRRLIVVVDVVFPLAALAFLVALARTAAHATSASRSTARILLALPIAYLALDAAENATVLWLLAAFPEELEGAGALVGWLTRGKRLAQGAALVAPLALLAVQGARVARARGARLRRGAA